MSSEVKKAVTILGVPLAFGSSLAGVDIGPSALRVARLNQRIAKLGYEVRDLGDMRIARPQIPLEGEQKTKYLPQVATVCEELALEVRNILNAGELPLVLGGDHSIAIGSIAGASSFYRERHQTLGLIWFDAHADMNTPETSPSGNIHGMPLSALLGFGATELTHVAGFAPKLDPKLCAHIGAFDLDQGARDLNRQLGIRLFTLRVIADLEISSCIDA